MVYFSIEIYKRAEGIRTASPDALWHADITVFATADLVKHYIYLVADNFSRKILAFAVADKVSMQFRRDTILKALKHVAKEGTTVTLLTDGGPENNFDGLDVTPNSLSHLTSLVDVHYSNSLIEAHNKILKYNYLYKMNVENGTQLKRMLEWIVNDYNNRPHVSLAGLSPNEKYQNQLPDKETHVHNIQKATLERTVYNKKHRCVGC